MTACETYYIYIIKHGYGTMRVEPIPTREGSKGSANEIPALPVPTLWIEDLEHRTRWLYSWRYVVFQLLES